MTKDAETELFHYEILTLSSSRFYLFFQNKTNNQCENNEKEFEALSEIEKCFVDSPKISFIETREKRFDKKC